MKANQDWGGGVLERVLGVVKRFVRIPSVRHSVLALIACLCVPARIQTPEWLGISDWSYFKRFGIHMTMAGQ